MDIEHDEGTILRLHTEQIIFQHAVIGIVQRQAFEEIGVGQRLAPDIQPPGLLRPLIDGGIPRPVEIDLEARALEDDTVGEVMDDFGGKGILFAQPPVLV